MAKIVQKKAIKPISLFSEIQDFVLPEVLRYQDNLQLALDEELEKGLRVRTVFPEKIPTGHQGVLSGTKSMSAEILLDTFIREKKEPLGLSYLLALLKEQHYVKSFFYEIRFLEILDMNMLFEKAGQWHSVCLKKQQERIVLDISEYVSSDKDGRVLINQSERISPSSVRFLVSFIEDQEEHPLKNKTIG